jgi:type I restriction enzyme S subunit
MRSEAYREQIIASAKGTTVLMLTKDAVESFRFAKPPTIISTKFSALCEALYEKMSQTSIENELLIKLRDFLLPKLIAGELRLPTSINEAENQA